MATGADPRGRARRRLHAQARAGRRARSRRDRLHHRRHQDGGRLQGRRHHHRGAPPGGRAAARLQAGAAGGVLRPVPDRCRRLRAAARQPGQAAPQRCELRIRARDLGRAGLRLPLRLSRAAASGDHRRSGWSASSTSTSSPPRPRSSTTSISPTATMVELHNPVDMPDPVQDRPYRGALDQGDHPGARRLSRQRPGALRGAARRAEGPDLCRQPRHGGLSPAAERGGVRFLRPAQIGQPRLCQLRLSDGRLRAGRPGADEHPGQRRAGRCARHHRPPQPGRAARPRAVRAPEGI